ncbi:MAG: glycine cleavage system protein GcvH [Planctomycetes bacterium]|nr:glycine cleavage system protein GcvH [Planctomycetota bacterium]
MSRPDDVVYTRTHEWARIEGETATVGITDHAVEQLGDLVFIDLPEVGSRVRLGESFGEIESTKTVSDLVAPLSGEVVEVNSEAAESVDLVSRSPFEEGWLIKIRSTDAAERSGLLSAAEYEVHVESEAE